MIPSIPRWLVAGLLLAGLGPVAQADETPSPDGMYQNAPKGLPSEPAWGYWTAAPKAWLMVHEQFVERTRKGGIDIVFLGDSITKGWKQVESLNWADTTPALQAVNYGIGGDTTRQILWRIQHGVLDGIHPRLIVLMIGTNNLYSDHNSGTNEQIADGVKAILALIREKSPGSRILLLGVLPRQTTAWCTRIAALNGLLAGLASPGLVEFHDPGARFLGGDGRVKQELYNPDLVHLTAAGTEQLTALVKPWVKAMLQAPPAKLAVAK